MIDPWEAPKISGRWRLSCWELTYPLPSHIWVGKQDSFQKNPEPKHVFFFGSHTSKHSKSFKWYSYNCTSWCEPRFDSLLRCCTIKKGGRRVRNSILGPEVSTFFLIDGTLNFWKWLISTRNVLILNIAKRCNVFHVFSLGICNKNKRTTWVCLKIWRPSLKSHFGLAGNECYLSPSCWDKRPQQKLSYHPSSIPSLMILTLEAYFKDTIPKKIQKTYPIMNKNIAWFTSRTRGWSPKFPTSRVPSIWNSLYI